MTIEEKLQHFTMVTIESVHEECEKSLEEFKKEQDWKFETHKEQHLKEVRIKEKNLRDAIERQASKEYTYEQLHIKRKINHKQNELRARLFELVEKELSSTRSAWRPPSCSVSRKASTILSASCGPQMRAPKAMILQLLCARQRRALTGSETHAQRTP